MCNMDINSLERIQLIQQFWPLSMKKLSANLFNAFISKHIVSIQHIYLYTGCRTDV